MSVNMRPGTASMFPSPLQAAGEAGVSAGLAYDRQGEAQMREMTRMGLNPDSPRYAGLRQEWGLRKTAGVAGQKTRAAQSARAASFERLLSMISQGRSGGAFREQALYAGRGGSSTAGRSAFASGVRGIGEADPRVGAMTPVSAADYRARQAGVTRVALTPNLPAPVERPIATRPLATAAPRGSAFGSGVFLNGQEVVRDTRAPGIYQNGRLVSSPNDRRDLPDLPALRAAGDLTAQTLDEPSLLSEGGRRIPPYYASQELPDRW